MVREEMIFVAYRPVKGLGKLAYHLSLNYIDKAGNHFVIDGGPEYKIGDFIPAAIFTAKEQFLSPPRQNKDSAFGRLILHDQYSPRLLAQKRSTYKNGQIIAPHTMIKTGDNLAELWSRMGKTASWLDGRYEYRPTTQNSNSFIGTILRKENLYNNISIPQYTPETENADKDNFIEGLDSAPKNRWTIPGARNDPKNSYKEEDIPFLGPEHFPNVQNINQREQDIYRPEESFYNKPKRVQLAKPRPDPNTHQLKNLPQKGPERVKHDPDYNPFNKDGNGFEDLEGEVFIWKHQPYRKDPLIIAAGRGDFFGVDPLKAIG